MTDNNTPDSTEEVVTQVTPDSTEETAEERQDISEVGKNFEETSRTAKLATKEAKRYQEFYSDGEVDYEGIKSIYRGNKISETALAEFCTDNGLDIEEVKERLVNPVDEIKKLRQELEELKKGKPEPEKTFTDILKSQLEERGLSEREFMKYKDEFEEELDGLQGLPVEKAIATALNLVVKERSQVKLTKSDTKSTVSSNIMTEAEYLGFLSKRSTQVGNDQAVAELEKYEAERKAKGEPMFK